MYFVLLTFSVSLLFLSCCSCQLRDKDSLEFIYLFREEKDAVSSAFDNNAREIINKKQLIIMVQRSLPWSVTSIAVTWVHPQI